MPKILSFGMKSVVIGIFLFPIFFFVSQVNAQSTITLNPVADAHVNKLEASKNFGTDKQIKSDKDRTIYMKFNLASLQGQTITNATLRMYVAANSSVTHQIKSVANTSWTETGIVYNNRPVSGSVIATITGPTTGVWRTVDVTDNVELFLGQLWAISIENPPTVYDSLYFASREETTRKPELIIQVAPLGTPTPSPTIAPTNTPTPSPTATPSPTQTLTPTPTSTPVPTATPTATPTPTPTEPPLPTSTPTVTPTPSPTQEPTPTEEPTPTDEPSPSPSPTVGPTGTPSPTPTVTPIPTPTPQFPAERLNLLNWKITLPVGNAGSPIEIKQPILNTYAIDPWFVINPSGDGVRFRAPVNGVTTNGSSNPRSELREMTNNGITNASWSSTAGTHTMYLDQAITAVPQIKKHVVAGQIHGGGDDVIVIRLEYPKLYIDINGDDGPVLDPNYTLGERFTVQFVVNGGETKIYYNGSPTPAYTLVDNYSGAYFKAGAYTQSYCVAKGGRETDCSDSNYGEVIIYDAVVTHSN